MHKTRALLFPSIQIHPPSDRFHSLELYSFHSLPCLGTGCAEMFLQPVSAVLLADWLIPGDTDAL